MRLHKSEAHFKERLNETAKCPACSQQFVIGNGTVYEGVYTKGGEQTYGYVVFCSLECITQIMEAEGNA